MTNNISRCPHVATIGSIEKQDYLNAIEVCFVEERKNFSDRNLCLVM